MAVRWTDGAARTRIGDVGARCAAPRRRRMVAAAGWAMDGVGATRHVGAAMARDAANGPHAAHAAARPQWEAQPAGAQRAVVVVVVVCGEVAAGEQFSRAQKFLYRRETSC